MSVFTCISINKNIILKVAVFFLFKVEGLVQLVMTTTHIVNSLQDFILVPTNIAFVLPCSFRSA